MIVSVTFRFNASRSPSLSNRARATMPVTLRCAPPRAARERARRRCAVNQGRALGRGRSQDATGQRDARGVHPALAVVGSDGIACVLSVKALACEYRAGDNRRPANDRHAGLRRIALGGQWFSRQELGVCRSDLDTRWRWTARWR
jgi:hypothetical protein